mgnify:CR=1 FL=1
MRTILRASLFVLVAWLLGCADPKPEFIQAEAHLAAIRSAVFGWLISQAGTPSARFPDGASDQLVRIVTENSRTLKFDSQGFEKE